MEKQETCETCVEACVERDLIIATMRQELDLLRDENARLRQSVRKAVGLLGLELLERR